MEETKHQISSVAIEEFYSKENGIVYWNYRFNGGEWHKETTTLDNLPWVEVNFAPIDQGFHINPKP